MTSRAHEGKSTARMAAIGDPSEGSLIEMMVEGKMGQFHSGVTPERDAADRDGH